jgi:hypothetical protein
VDTSSGFLILRHRRAAGLSVVSKMLWIAEQKTSFIINETVPAEKGAADSCCLQHYRWW